MTTVRQRPLFLAFLISTSVVLFVACKGEEAAAPAATAPNNPVAMVTLDPPAANIEVGATVQLTATPRDKAGNALSGFEVKWASNAPGVARVSETGLVTGASPCLAKVTAVSGGRIGSASITVTTVRTSGAVSRAATHSCG